MCGPISLTDADLTRQGSRSSWGLGRRLHEFLTIVAPQYMPWQATATRSRNCFVATYLTLIRINVNNGR